MCKIYTGKEITTAMIDETLHFEIEPVFMPYQSVYNNFARIEKQCDVYLGLPAYDNEMMIKDYDSGMKKEKIISLSLRIMITE